MVAPDHYWWVRPLTLFVLGGLMLLWAWWHPGGLI